MAIITRDTNEATHQAEVIFTRDLSSRYGIDEVETDYEVAYFIGKPDETQLENLVPEGWEFREAHIIDIRDIDLDEYDNENSLNVEPWQYNASFDAEDDIEGLDLEAV
jgi:hypothetical protein